VYCGAKGIRAEVPPPDPHRSLPSTADLIPGHLSMRLLPRHLA